MNLQLSAKTFGPNTRKVGERDFAPATLQATEQGISPDKGDGASVQALAAFNVVDELDKQQVAPSQ